MSATPALLDDPTAWLQTLSPLPAQPSVYPRMLLLRRPDGFRHDADSARDNHYMRASRFDAARATAQWQALVDRLRQAGHLVAALPGDADTPEAVFPNNVHATARVAGGRLIIGAMRHPQRQREADDGQVMALLAGSLGLQVVDLRGRGCVAELTGSLVIDRGRQIGYCGLSERCDRAGAAAMAAAFGLRHCALFELAPGEYHTNVVMSALGSRGILLHPQGLADPAWARALQQLLGERLICIDAQEKAHYAGNCIALADDQLWMSEQAASHLRADTRARLESLGFRIHQVALDEIEQAGGSLRCMIGEVY